MELRIGVFLTAIESFTSWGRLDPFNAAETADAWREDWKPTRGVRSAVESRLVDIRSGIVYDGEKQKGKRRVLSGYRA
jgi:hypothetical protein